MCLKVFLSSVIYAALLSGIVFGAHLNSSDERDVDLYVSHDIFGGFPFVKPPGVDVSGSRPYDPGATTLDGGEEFPDFNEDEDLSLLKMRSDPEEDREDEVRVVQDIKRGTGYIQRRVHELIQYLYGLDEESWADILGTSGSGPSRPFGPSPLGPLLRFLSDVIPPSVPSATVLFTKLHPGVNLVQAPSAIEDVLNEALGVYDLSKIFATSSSDIGPDDDIPQLNEALQDASAHGYSKDETLKDGSVKRAQAVSLLLQLLSRNTRREAMVGIQEDQAEESPKFRIL
ncbi:unnamed protein product [Notodromas monacha]|uniref:Uncharacterized protein n=1 Tax=Notodromas monacha TaxID=399045 RepID=A0A7R9BX34_9CRUS|nr:unnamed protein product [Notodromas monacha]CAG0922211.1 unnamed protein product [Notodromas monacha]